LAMPSQRTARRAFVGDALRRLARLDAEDPELEPAAGDFEYRTKLALAVGPGARRIGLHPLGRADAIFDLERCHLTVRPLMDLWAVLRNQRGLLPAGLERLVLRLDRAGSRHVIARVAGTVVWTRAAELGRELDRRGVAGVLWWHPEGGVARVVAGRGEGAPPSVSEQVHPAMGDRV